MGAGHDQDAGVGGGQGKSEAITEKASCNESDYMMCIECDETLDVCVCVCKFCKERDGCECALFDAATGG